MSLLLLRKIRPRLPLYSSKFHLFGNFYSLRFFSSVQDTKEKATPPNPNTSNQKLEKIKRHKAYMQQRKRKDFDPSSIYKQTLLTEASTSEIYPASQILLGQIQERIDQRPDVTSNYIALLNDTHRATVYIFKYPFPIIESTLEVFRKGLFPLSARKSIVYEITRILQNDMNRNRLAMIHCSQEDTTLGRAKDLYRAYQTVLEFMDKGMKGLLTGDLSLNFLMQTKKLLQSSRSRFEQQILKLEENLKDQKSLEQFFSQEFALNQAKYKENSPSYTFTKKHGKGIEVDHERRKKTIKLTENKYASNLKNRPPLHLRNFENRKLLSKEGHELTEKRILENVEFLKEGINRGINRIYEQLIQYALSVDVYRIPFHGISMPDYQNPINLFQRQLLLEELSFDMSREKYKETLQNLIKIGRAHELATSHRIILNWMNMLQKAVEEQQRIFMKRGALDQDKNKVGHLFLRLPADRIASVCVLYLIKLLFKNIQQLNPEMVQSFEQIDRMMEEAAKDDQKTEDLYWRQANHHDLNISAAELFFEIGGLFHKEYKHYHNEIQQRSKRGGKQLSKDSKSSEVEQRIQEALKASDEEIKPIPYHLNFKLGAFLVNLMVRNLTYQYNDLTLPLLRPKIVKHGSGDNYYTQGFYYFSKRFVDHFLGELDKLHDLNLQLERSLPMIYKPAGWKSFLFGGYYLKQTKMARFISQYKQPIKHLQQNDLSQITQTLNNVGDVRWRLNKTIVEMIEFVWASGGGQAEIPARFNNRAITPEILKEENTFRKRLNILREQQLNRENHSLRCEFLLRLGIAKCYMNVGTIYFPHNMDFRGRVYPIPPHLNHMGADISRGLLQYSDGKPLGKRGLYWLKIHFANKMGKDKLSLKEREEYTDSMLPWIHRVAKDPQNNLDWFSSENPWQALAVLLDIDAAIRSGDNENYICHNSVHLDGSCNGLQHYAAIGRDTAGAEQVNLMDTDRPADVYTAVLELVKEEVRNERRPEYQEIAKSLLPHLVRKIIKQTVMTSVYGVTFIGARQQIARQLKDKKIFETNRERFEASKYLASVTLKSIGDLFKHANQIKTWFSQCARLVASQGETVKWNTPLNLPCVQPYKRPERSDIINTVIQQLSLTASLDEQPVNKTKQNTAFPPNFIHSLDSTHMMQTANRCKEKGFTFAAVHDSFWVHPSDIDELNVILREEFIKLHSQALLEELFVNFQQRFPHVKFPPIPPRGSFDLDEIKKATYFFS